MKNSLLAFSLLAVLLVTGCDQTEKTTETTTTETTETTTRPAHGEPGHNHETDHQGAAMYTCPMHPEVTSDKPGTCPKCGMDLVKAEDMQAEPAN